MAGPAGLLCNEVVSPGMTERRVVLGVQEPVAPKHVSRTKICRMPLLDVPDGDGYFEGVTERNATKRPDELTEGRRLSFPASAPPSSVETSVVSGVQEAVAPKQVSRTKIWRPAGVEESKFVAAELNATKRPSALIEGVLLSALPAEPSGAEESKVVRAWQSEPAPLQVSRRKTCEWPPCAAVYATRRPSEPRAGVSSATVSAADAFCAFVDTPAVQLEMKVESAETAKPGKNPEALELVPPPPLKGLPTPLGGAVATAGGLKTETMAQVCDASRSAGTVAVIAVALTFETTSVFCVPLAFQRTCDPPDGSEVGRNCLPVRLRVNAGLPGAALFGVRESSSGSGLGAGLITKLMVLESPLSFEPE